MGGSHPSCWHGTPGFPGFAPAAADEQIADEIVASGTFEEPLIISEPWSASFTADSFLELLLTQSDHRLVDDATRAELFGAIGEVIQAHGGDLAVPHVTLLVLSRAR